MRKIEQKLIAAIAAAPNYGCSVNRIGGNTTVETDHLGGLHIFLHGHKIAIKHRGEAWRVSLAGWNTTTTRSRVSTIIRDASERFNNARGPLLDPAADAAGPYRYPCGLGVSSRKGVIRLHDVRGETVINATDWHEVQL